MKLWVLKKKHTDVSVTVIPKQESKVTKFCKTVAVVAYRKVIRFFVGCWQHAESIILLLLAAYGVNALLSLLPFMVTLPLWVELVMVIPFISVCIILALTKIAEWRGGRRVQRMAMAW